MDAEKPGGLSIVAGRLLKRFEHQLPFNFLDCPVIFGHLDARHRLLFEQGFREILGLNQFRRSEHDGSLQCIFKFADIAGPIVLGQALARFRRDPLYRPSRLLAESHCKIAGQERNVVAALAKRGHRARKPR